MKERKKVRMHMRREKYFNHLKRVSVRKKVRKSRKHAQISKKGENATSEPETVTKKLHGQKKTKTVKMCG